jgi:hypothetical protein
MSTNDLIERLDVALDAVLAVRVTLGGVAGPALPDDALDAALGLHQGFQEAGRDFVDALQAVHRGGAADEAILGIEAAAHAMVGQAAEAAWRLGLLVRGDTRG